MQALSEQIETIVLQHGNRGMDAVRRALRPGYCLRAAQLLAAARGVVLIGTGFPVAGTFESDGPVGGIGLYRVLAQSGSQPMFVCAPPISRALAPDFDTLEMPIAGWRSSRAFASSILKTWQPAALVSVERPGLAADGRYYNMRAEDISAATAKFDLLFDTAPCPRIAFGDGGNEIGMGNVQSVLRRLAIVPSVTRCDELVVATVSNWGVYGVIAMLGALQGRDLLGRFNPADILAHLAGLGCVDGITRKNIPSEDGFPASTGAEIIRQLRLMVDPYLRDTRRGHRQ